MNTLRICGWGLAALATGLAGLITAMSGLVLLVSPGVPGHGDVFLIGAGGALATWLGYKATVWLADLAK